MPVNEYRFAVLNFIIDNLIVINFHLKKKQNFLLLDENISTNHNQQFINSKEKKKLKKQAKQNLFNNVQIVSVSMKDSLKKPEKIFNSSLIPEPVLIADDCSKLIVNNITAKWNNDLIRPTLSNINVRLKPGDLLAVIGSVGSGKVSCLFYLNFIC